MTLIRHAVSGLHYVHVIPPSWGPYADIRACYMALAKRLPWLSVMTEAGFVAAMSTELYQDDMVMFVLWSELDPGPRDRRRALVVPVYSEALDDDVAKMLPDHLAVWTRFSQRAPNYDAAFAHTPWMSSMMAHAGLRGYVLPVGWDPEAMGRPRPDVPRSIPITVHGSLVGRRSVLFPYLLGSLPGILRDISGQYGRSLLGTLDHACATLYIAHSRVRSFSTWRLWQALAADVAVIAEPGDSWPFEAGKHYVDLEPVEVATAEHAAIRLKALVHETPHVLASAVRAVASDIAPVFTTQHCVDQYLVPASIQITRERT